MQQRQMLLRSCPAVPPANANRPTFFSIKRDVYHILSLILIVSIFLAGHVNAESKNSHGTELRHLQPPGQQSSSAAASHSKSGSTATTGQALHHGRSLKQLGYDPYGIGYYDPYQSGVTPGFINVDLNRETGLHVDVGTVAVDVSADKNYYGLGVGNLVGVGAAKDRGWNLQLAGGNVLDVSVTKDAGLGLWLLNGLANIQIGPDGRGWETGHIAAQNVPGQEATASTAATTAAVSSGQPAQQATSVVVDETNADSTATTKPSEAAADGQVHASSDTDAVPAEEPIITEEPINVDLSTAAAAAAAGEIGSSPTAAVPSAARLRSSAAAARRSRPPTYVEPRPAVVVVEGNRVMPATEPQSTDVAAVPAAPEPFQDRWGEQAHAAAVPKRTPGVRSRPIVAAAAAPYAVPSSARAPQVVPAVVAAAPAARHACEGGAMVATAGNVVKCRYRRTKQSALQARPHG